MAWARRPSRSTSASPRSPPAAAVRFSTLAAALADLLGQESVAAFDRRIRRYTRPDLLILDELGYLPCDSRAADILYAIISRRHGAPPPSSPPTSPSSSRARSSLAPPASSPSSTASHAQHCHRVEIIGPSWRDKHRLDPTTGRRPAPTGHDVSARDLVDRQITSDPRCRRTQADRKDGARRPDGSG
ncbi:MAG: ATP-binding protein [Kofleriaceae bacterium]|nr:ATP-binding protein [Kofleriaceae bacterium]